MWFGKNCFKSKGDFDAFKFFSALKAESVSAKGKLMNLLEF
jgi:hypothetical protein